MNNKQFGWLFATTLLLIASAALVGENKTHDSYSRKYLQTSILGSQKIDSIPYSQLLVLDSKADSSPRCSMVLDTSLFITLHGKSIRLRIDFGCQENTKNSSAFGSNGTTTLRGLAM